MAVLQGPQMSRPTLSRTKHVCAWIGGLQRLKAYTCSMNRVGDISQPRDLTPKAHSHLSRKFSPLTCIGPPGDCVCIVVPRMKPRSSMALSPSQFVCRRLK